MYCEHPCRDTLREDCWDSASLNSVDRFTVSLRSSAEIKMIRLDDGKWPSRNFSYRRTGAPQTISIAHDHFIVLHVNSVGHTHARRQLKRGVGRFCREPCADIDTQTAGTVGCVKDLLFLSNVTHSACLQWAPMPICHLKAEGTTDKQTDKHHETDSRMKTPNHIQACTHHSSTL